MKKSFFLNALWSSLAILLLQPMSTFAQPGVSPYYNATPSLAGRTVIIPAGTTLEGRIESTIGSSVSRQGSSFTISLSSPVLANGSDVIIPAGAIITGEVVQAIPAKDVPHAKKEKPTGKLRVQITALRMPDGITYPMVASLVGEEVVRNQYNMYNPYGASSNPVRGSGVGYTGTPTGFESVAPGRAHFNPRSGMAQVVTKNEMLNDPIMGRDKNMDNEKLSMRSLVKKNRNLYIYNGSPLTIRLEAPFKIGIGSSAGEESALNEHFRQSQPKVEQPAMPFVPNNPPPKNPQPTNQDSSNF